MASGWTIASIAVAPGTSLYMTRFAPLVGDVAVPEPIEQVANGASLSAPHADDLPGGRTGAKPPATLGGAHRSIRAGFRRRVALRARETLGVLGSTSADTARAAQDRELNKLAHTPAEPRPQRRHGRVRRPHLLEPRRAVLASGSYGPRAQALVR